MASLRSWRDFVLVAKPRVNTIEWRNREEIGELNCTQGLSARDFPRGRVEIDHTYKHPDVPNVLVDPPPKTTRSRVPPATQATPWQDFINAP